jgi:hypothetical protein
MLDQKDAALRVNGHATNAKRQTARKTPNEMKGPPYQPLHRMIFYLAFGRIFV